MVSYKGLPLSIVHVTTREPPLTRLVFVHDRVPDGLGISRVPLFLQVFAYSLGHMLALVQSRCSAVLLHRHSGAKLVTYQA